jgi:hypothetical protein
MSLDELDRMSGRDCMSLDEWMRWTVALGLLAELIDDL